MSYIFPRRRLRSADVLDPLDLDHDAMPAAWKYGRLDAHDFRSDIVLTLSTGALWNYSWYQVNSDPGVAVATGPDTIPPAGNSWKLPNTGAWHAVGDTENVSLTTGVGRIWVVGWLQYFWQTWDSQVGISATPSVPIIVEFGLRVDGRVIEWTRTGIPLVHGKPFDAMKCTEERSSSLALPGPATPRAGRAFAIGPAAMPVRIEAKMDVMPGAHTIELVARRPRDTANRERYQTNDYVAIYSRRLFALETPFHPGAVVSTDATVDVAAWEPEESLSAANLGTTRVDRLRTSFNAIAEGAVARGAFMSRHLPSGMATQANSDTNNPAAAPAATDNFYPGYGVNTVINTRTGQTAWFPVDEGAGAAPTNPLRAAPSGGGNWDTDAATALFLIFANVQVVSAFDPGNGISGQDENLGAYSIGYLPDGAADPAGIVILSSSIGFVNQFAFFNDGTAAIGTPINTDVPLFFIVDGSSNPIAGDVDWFGVFASGLDTQGAARVENRFWRSSIQVLQLRR